MFRIVFINYIKSINNNVFKTHLQLMLFCKINFFNHNFKEIKKGR